MLAKLIYKLFKKGVMWEWKMEQDLAMATLKKALTEVLALVKIDYSDLQDPSKGLGNTSLLKIGLLNPTIF